MIFTYIKNKNESLSRILQGKFNEANIIWNFGLEEYIGKYLKNKGVYPKDINKIEAIYYNIDANINYILVSSTDYGYYKIFIDLSGNPVRWIYEE